MKIDWKKEWDFQVAQGKGMYHGIHKDLAITLALMGIVIPPILGMLLVFDWMVKMW